MKMGVSGSDYQWKNDNYYYRKHFRLSVIAGILRSFPSDRKLSLLDLGCGPATLSGLISDNFEYYGCDGYQKHLPNHEKNIKEYSYWIWDDKNPSLPFRDKSFDFIVCSGFLEYVIDRERFLNLVRRRLAPGGLMIASFINFARWDREIGFWLCRILNVCPRFLYHPAWQRRMNYRKLVNILEEAGLKVHAAIPLPTKSSTGTPQLKVYGCDEILEQAASPINRYLRVGQVLFMTGSEKTECKLPTFINL